MKKFVNFALAVMGVGAVALSFAGCNSSDTGKCVVLGKPVAAQQFDYAERKDEGFIAIKQKAANFAYKFSAAAYSNSEEDGNFSVAPVSVFSALSLAAECAGGETRGELLAALDVDYNGLSDNFLKLYRSLNGEYKSSGGSLEGAFRLSNSVWINDGVQYNEDCVNSLSQKYFAYSYSADFANDNANANKAVRSFINDSTNGLIDRDFELSSETLFTLVNALYLKDIWNMYGDELSLTADKYVFTESDGNTEQLNLLSGGYVDGRVRQCDGYSTFFTQTLNGYKIKFIMPEAGRSVGELFTAETLAAVNGMQDFEAADDVNKINYHTRCLFPEFKTSYDGNITDILKNDFNVNKIFDASSCDFSSFTQNAAYCQNVRHVNTLTVNRKGIEGAAVTVLPVAGTPGPGEYTDVYEDFVVDRAFGFILTDACDTVLFSGIVNKV